MPPDIQTYFKHGLRCLSSVAHCMTLHVLPKQFNQTCKLVELFINPNEKVAQLLFYSVFIMKTYLIVYTFDPFISHFYIVQLGFTGVYIIFLISAQKHRLWVLVTQRAHDVNITSPQRRCNVMTLHRRWGDVVFTSCACRVEPPRRGGSNEYHKLCFEQKYETYQIFLSEKISFWWWNFQ